MIYFDNAATSFSKPKLVKDAVINALNNYCANPGRSSHALAQQTAMQIFYTREKVAKFFSAARTEDVIFTKNCTEALNIAILGSAKKGGHVITTALEHNSVLRSLFKLKSDGIIELTIIPPNEDGVITSEMFESAVKENTYMIACTHISNVTGVMNDIHKIGSLCKRKKLIFLLDGAQSAGHELIDVTKSNVGLFCFAGHKGLYGITGSGGLIVSNVRLNPIMFGGTGTFSQETKQPTDIPEGFESGTLATIPIISLGAGVDFVKNNFMMLREKIEYLTRYLIERLSKLKYIKKYYNPKNCHGVVSFNIENINSTLVADELSESYGICVRAGLHCAPLIHEHMKTTYSGAVRVSLSALNSKFEVDELIVALGEIKKKFSQKNANNVL